MSEFGINLEENKEEILLLERTYDFSKEHFAIVLTLFLYRNTIIEDFHCKNIKMDEKLYKTIYGVVYRGYKLLAENKRILEILLSDRPIFTFVKELNEKKLNVRVAQGIFVLLPSNPGWDKPTKLDIEIPKSKVKFILDGEFKKCCNEGCYLNDDIMCRVNKDICNRIYTLLINDIL